MPKKTASQKENTGFGKLAAFSELVHGSPQILRNHLNESQLSGWLEEVASERVGPMVEEDHASSLNATRESLCRGWVAKVARGHMIRKGECAKASLSKRDLALSPEWLSRAASRGVELTRLLMTQGERDELCSILDWLRSDQGPSMASDWSKVSWPQALEAEKLWIEKLGKAAAQKDMEASDALGTEFFCEATGSDGSAGWRWVKVKSRDSLNREGSLMKHCVGSYVKDVEEGRMDIYSLRDGLNKPLLTIESKGSGLRQLKAFANQACPEELRGCVGEFLSVFTQNLAGGVEAKLSRDFEASGYEVVPGLGVIDQRAGLSKDQKEVFAFWIKDAESGGKDAIRKFGQVCPVFARIGFVEAVKVCLELCKPTFEELANGLVQASHGGHLEVVKLLLPVSDPKADESQSLRLACINGHLEIVKLLLPVSDPKANDSAALRWACQSGNLEIVKLLLPVSDPRAKNSCALAWACEKGHLEVFKLLLPVSDPKENDSWALRSACQNGHLEVVKLLLPVSDPKACDYRALGAASQSGHLEIVKLLLPVSDPKACESQALRLACDNGHLEIVKLLLPVSDPKAGDSAALRLACMYGHPEVVKLLLPVSGPKDIDRAKTLAKTLDSGKDREDILELLAERENNCASQEPLCVKSSVAAKLSKRRVNLNPASGQTSNQAP